MADKQITITINEDGLKVLDELKKGLGESTNAGVIRKALALANIAVKNADNEKTLTILDKNQDKQRIVLSL